MDKLIEMMVRACIDSKWSTTPTQKAEIMLSVIRQNVHLVAVVCPECSGAGWYKQSWGCKEKCDICKGHGVVAREDVK